MSPSTANMTGTTWACPRSSIVASRTTRVRSIRPRISSCPRIITAPSRWRSRSLTRVSLVPLKDGWTRRGAGHRWGREVAGATAQTYQQDEYRTEGREPDGGQAGEPYRAHRADPGDQQ